MTRIVQPEELLRPAFSPLSDRAVHRLLTPTVHDEGMDTNEIAAAWVSRTIGFGATVHELDRARAIGIRRFVDELFDPKSSGIEADGDPWDFLLGQGVAGRQIVGFHGDRADSEGDIAISVPAQDLFAEALRWLGARSPRFSARHHRNRTHRLILGAMA